MIFPRLKDWLWRAGLGSLAVVALTAWPAEAQLLGRRYEPAPSSCPTDGVPLYQGNQVPPTDTTRPPDNTSGAATGMEAPPSVAEFRPPAGPGEMVSVQDSRGGYIDSAIVGNQLRLRYESAYDDNRPDRAEFFYAKCGCFGPALNGRGPRLAETRIDYQDISAYAEAAFGERFSAFVEVPFIFLNPDQNANTAGFADMNVGFKYALLSNADQVGTFQLRTYIPTGAASHGLGNDHVSLEPALLYYQRLSDRLSLEAEMRDWIPIGGTDFEGNVTRYGVGLSYAISKTPDYWIAPVVELVGWTVLNGKELAFPDGAAGVTLDSSGATIVNAKVGVRVGFGANSSLYAGYGRALTGDVWYKDIIRVEYRLAF